MKRRYVYVATWGEFVKIGMSEDPPRRVRNLASQPVPFLRPPGRPELVGYVEGGVGAENLLHSALAEHHLGGEWFRRAGTVNDVVFQARQSLSCNSHGPVPKQEHTWRAPRPLVIYPEVFTRRCSPEQEPWSPPEIPDF